MIALGCDVGSLFTKAAIFDEDDLVASSLMPTTGDVQNRLDSFFKDVAQTAGLKVDEIESAASTGNGRDLVPIAQYVEEEMHCIGAAVSFFLPDVKTIICVGGQNITTLHVDSEGLVTGLMRNDKCASGSGRFLEQMAAKLGVGLDRIDAVASEKQETVQLSGQCGVFLESELITHVNNGVPVADVMAGVCESVASMVSGQARRLGLKAPYTIVGGVARFESVVKMICEKLGPGYVPFKHDPQFVAAIGAALLAGS